MKKSTIVLATPHARHDKLESELRNHPNFSVFRIREKDELTKEKLSDISPDFVFFPHWSWIIPRDIHEQFNCVIFHMTDLPFGRGGSPLQNLIARGIYESKLSAIACSKDLDAGPVYLKKEISLYGSAEEIFCRAAKLMEEMIPEIVQTRRQPQAQVGEPTLFTRRRREDGDISTLASLEKIHDYIRMLDADGYPNAFLRVGDIKFEFVRSRLSHDHIYADVRITVEHQGDKQ